jgi:glycogen debranching enzyme
MHRSPPEEQFPIIADTERPATPLRVLKYNDTFGVFDHHGDIRTGEAGEEGIYHDGTRFLSRFELFLFGGRPLLLSSTISGDNARFDADLTNVDVRQGDHVAIARGEIHLSRSRVLWDARCLERIRVSNYRREAVEVPLTLRFDADFSDVFEVRGTRRARRGERLPDEPHPQYVMRYRGLDDVVRCARLEWSIPPTTLDRGLARFVLTVEPMGATVLELSVTCEAATAAEPAFGFEDVLGNVRARRAEQAEDACQIFSGNTTFNRWLTRSMADLQMMITDTPQGLYPYAGIPWFSTPFGRDGLITAFELLWVKPAVARGVLSFLASTQATSHNDAQDAQPGKILHEMRGGEMAALGEVPFGRYYGTADATPLFVTLAAAYYRRTGDAAFIDQIWPHIVAALDWMRVSGDMDGDGFIEYARQSEHGLHQQGWKDSHDSVFHADSTFARGPIALCEVQAYAYGAWKGAARLAAMRGDQRAADDWRGRAESLRARFEESFWCEDLGTYALALDGDKRPCRVRTSNAGQCLFTGIASAEHARRLAATLFDESLFSGWGVRTVAVGEARYNPMSYHNGSIWPHDNALVAMGLSRYGYTAAAARIMATMFDLSEVVDLHRLPELICGFPRRGREHPTQYPVACAPQAWAAGAIYMLLGACLGLRIDAPAKRLSFSMGLLPDTIEWLRLSNLVIGAARVDLRLEWHPHDIGLTVLRREGQLDIVAMR